MLPLTLGFILLPDSRALNLLTPYYRPAPPPASAPAQSCLVSPQQLHRVGHLRVTRTHTHTNTHLSGPEASYCTHARYLSERARSVRVSVALVRKRERASERERETPSLGGTAAGPVVANSNAQPLLACRL